MFLRKVIHVAAVLTIAITARADEPLYQYEGNVLPYDPSAGWIVADPCEEFCNESIEQDQFVLYWPHAGDDANYHLWIAQAPKLPPTSLWAEWRFRSNHPIGLNFFTCDAAMIIKYGGIIEVVFMYGDAAISFSGDDFVPDLVLNEFHTYRFESMDGISYTVSVDGHVFIEAAEDIPNGYHYLQFSGDGGCNSDWIPDMVNAWDYVRYGTLSTGEQVIATSPPSGFVDVKALTEPDRFAVTFDAPNFVHVDQITVETTTGPAPQVLRTWRRDIDGPESLEIVLDRPLPADARIRFILDDGQIQNVIDYSTLRGDYNADALVNLDDFQFFNVCLSAPIETSVSSRSGLPASPSSCPAFDFDNDNDVDLQDFGQLQAIFESP